MFPIEVPDDRHDIILCRTPHLGTCLSLRTGSRLNKPYQNFKFVQHSVSALIPKIILVMADIFLFDRAAGGKLKV